MNANIVRAVLLLTLASTVHVQAGEGLVSTIAGGVTPAHSRDRAQARFVDGAALGVQRQSENGVMYRDEERAAKLSLAKTAHLSREPDRPANAPLRNSAYSFRLWDAGSSLLHDVDGDGYHREFKIRFDADVSSGSSKVYAKLYLRRVGDSGSWKHYYSTNDFWINGNSDTDDYYVETVLDDGFATADYDVLIDLYESGYSGIVATMGPFEDDSLRDLPLEDIGLDQPVVEQGYHINSVSTELLIDDDRDGYYSKFRITFDPDRDFGAAMAYAVLWVREPGGEWLKEHTSSLFQVDDSGTQDEYTFTGDWLSGYDTARYDVQIDLYDAASNMLVATVGSERAELSRVPLEDANKDRAANGGGSSGGGDSSSDEYGGGGGSWGLIGSILLGWLGLRRRV